MPMSSTISIARVLGKPYDPKRLDLFQKLHESAEVMGKRLILPS